MIVSLNFSQYHLFLCAPLCSLYLCGKIFFMTTRQTPAIVLQIRDYGEADRLVNFLTPDAGRVSGIAKHAKKSHRRFANCLEPLNRVIFQLSPKPRGDLEFIQQGELVQSFSNLRRDLRRLAASAVLAELAGELSTPPETTAAIFRTLSQALEHLDAGADPDSLLPPFLLHILQLGGYGPRWGTCRECGREPAPPLYFSIPRGGVICDACSRAAAGPLFALTPGTWKLLRLASEMPLEKLTRLRFPPAQRDQSLAVLQKFLRHHLGRNLKSWTFWEKMCRATKTTETR
jgi:DNA repair protein RecO (recombination protein O)